MPHGDHVSEEDFNRSQPPRQKMNVPRFAMILLIAVFAVFAVIALYSLFVLTALVRTGYHEARSATQRENIKQNLKQIELALQNYHIQEAEQRQHAQTNEPLQDQSVPRSD